MAGFRRGEVGAGAGFQRIVTVIITLPNGVRESRSGTIPSEAFDNPLRRASRCGRVWYDLLGGVVRKIDARIEESLFETAEA